MARIPKNNLDKHLEWLRQQQDAYTACPRFDKENQNSAKALEPCGKQYPQTIRHLDSCLDGLRKTQKLSAFETSREVRQASVSTRLPFAPRGPQATEFQTPASRTSEVPISASSDYNQPLRAPLQAIPGNRLQNAQTQSSTVLRSATQASSPCHTSLPSSYPQKQLGRRNESTSPAHSRVSALQEQPKPATTGRLEYGVGYEQISNISGDGRGSSHSPSGDRQGDSAASLVARTKDELREVQQQIEHARDAGDIPSALLAKRNVLDNKLAALNKLLKKRPAERIAPASQGPPLVSPALQTVPPSNFTCEEYTPIDSVTYDNSSSIVDRAPWMSTRTNSTALSSDTHLCPEHQVPCLMLTSRSENNPGRQFYKCSAQIEGNCSYFKWVDEDNCNAGGYAGTFEGDDAVKCSEHSIGCIRLTTKKPGDNYGRPFYRCSLPEDQQCDFFMWADEVVETSVNEAISSVMNKGIKSIFRVNLNIFGHRGFRPGQQQVIEAALKGQDVVVIMPTGGGKSLCYQLPACATVGLTVVVSPLLSLIQDQVQQLHAVGVPADCLSSSQEGEGAQNQVYAQLRHPESQMKLLYVTPEKVSRSRKFSELLQYLYSNGRLARFVIDEAHCISQWGHDFRPDYMQMKSLRELFPNIPIMALTATANERVKQDIIRAMKMSNPYQLQQSFNRENLRYDIRRKGGTFKKDLLEYIVSRPNDSGIIYCLSRNETETITAYLESNLPKNKYGRPLVTVDFYHAQRDDRHLIQERWSKGQIKLIVATVAFGMGINKPDVRYVIHITLPQSITHYYQESGRAGRDGEPATCILYYAYRDKNRVERVIRMEENKSYQRVHIENLYRMVNFCENEVECRRVLLMEYFGEQFDRAKCNGTCDNCKKNANQICKTVDVTKECKLILEIVEQAVQRLTVSQVLDILRGDNSKKSKQKNYNQLPQFGSVKGFTKFELERVIHQMIMRSYIAEEEAVNNMGYSNTYVVSGPCALRLRSHNPDRVEIQVRTKIAPPSSKAKDPKTQKSKKTAEKVARNKQATATSDIECIDDEFEDSLEWEELLTKPVESRYFAEEAVGPSRLPKRHVHALIERLKAWRDQKIVDTGQKVHMILINKSLNEVGRLVPQTLDELLLIEGIGSVKRDKHGPEIIGVVSNYLTEHNLQPEGDFKAFVSAATDQSGRKSSPHILLSATASSEGSTGLGSPAPTGSNVSKDRKGKASVKRSSTEGQWLSPKPKQMKLTSMGPSKAPASPPVLRESVQNTLLDSDEEFESILLNL